MACSGVAHRVRITKGAIPASPAWCDAVEGAQNVELRSLSLFGENYWALMPHLRLAQGRRLRRIAGSLHISEEPSGEGCLNVNAYLRSSHPNFGAKVRPA